MPQSRCSRLFSVRIAARSFFSETGTVATTSEPTWRNSSTARSTRSREPASSFSRASIRS